MTVFEALKATVIHPIDEDKAQFVCIKRGIDPNETVTQEIINSDKFELATADIYLLLVSSPSIAEGQYQISMTDKTNMLNLAKAIYAKYGEDHGFTTSVSIGTITAPNLW